MQAILLAALLAALTGCSACSRGATVDRGGAATTSSAPAHEATASPGDSGVLDPLARLEQDTGVPWVVAQSPKFGTPTSLLPRGETPQTLTSGTTPAAAAMSFFTKYGTIFQMVDPLTELALEDSGPDAAGSHASFTQREAGLAVFGTRLAVAFNRKGQIAGVSGLFVPKLHDFATKPALSPDAAIAKAQADVATRYPSSALSNPRPPTAPELLIYPLGASPVLAYRLSVSYLNAASNASNVAMDYVIDANSGDIVQGTSAFRNAGQAHGGFRKP